MRVKLLVAMASHPVSLNPGDELDLKDDEAIRMIDAGYCAPVASHITEKAVKRRPAEKRG